MSCSLTRLSKYPNTRYNESREGAIAFSSTTSHAQPNSQQLDQQQSHFDAAYSASPSHHLNLSRCSIWISRKLTYISNRSRPQARSCIRGRVSPALPTLSPAILLRQKTSLGWFTGSTGSRHRFLCRSILPVPVLHWKSAPVATFWGRNSRNRVRVRVRFPNFPNRPEMPAWPPRLCTME